jgi:hypothetical protein
MQVSYIAADIIHLLTSYICAYVHMSDIVNTLYSGCINSTVLHCVCVDADTPLYCIVTGICLQNVPAGLLTRCYDTHAGEECLAGVCIM